MIHGKCVTIRPIESGDQLFVSQLNSDPAVRANVVGWDFPQSLHKQEQWFESARPENTHRWLVEDSQGHRIGLTGLWSVDWHNRNALTALKLGGPGEARGRGLGRDAIKAVMAFAFYDAGLHRLHSTIIDGNTPSLKAYCDYSNWRVEGRSRDHVWRHGSYHDLIHIAALKSDFDALPDAQEYIERVTKGRA